MARLIIDLWDDRVQYFRAILEELRQRYGVRVELNIIENYLILRERWTRRSEAERKKAEETNEAIEHGRKKPNWPPEGEEYLPDF